MCLLPPMKVPASIILQEDLVVGLDRVIALGVGLQKGQTVMMFLTSQHVQILPDVHGANARAEVVMITLPAELVVPL